MDQKEETKKSFALGSLYMTAGVADLAAQNPEFKEFMDASLVRHAAGDWGDVDKHDREANDYALNHRERLFSVYVKQGEPKIWIITEWDRNATTILFPSEY